MIKVQVYDNTYQNSNNEICKCYLKEHLYNYVNTFVLYVLTGYLAHSYAYAKVVCWNSLDLLTSFEMRMPSADTNYLFQFNNCYGFMIFNMFDHAH